MDKNDLFHKLTYNHLLNHSKDTSTRGLALSEFIDNSIASYLKMKGDENEIGNITGCNIEIVVDERDPNNIKILIKDNAGGMSRSELLDAAQEFHNSHEKNSNQINQYGVGMKLAIFWYGKNGRIWTKKRNSPEYFLDYETYKHNQNDAVITPIIESKDNFIDGHGTIIQIDNVRDSRRILLNDKCERTTCTDVYETVCNRFREYINNGLIITFKLMTKDNPVEKQILKINVPYITEENVFYTKSFTLKNISEIKDTNYITKDTNSITNEQRQLLSKNRALAMDLSNKPILKNNKDYAQLFDKIEFDQPLIIEEKILLNKKELKVKLCFLSKPSGKYSGVAIKHCNRFIHHVPNSATNKSGAMPFSSNPRFSGWIFKWMYAEVDLTDTEKYGVFPDKNKASILWDDEKLTSWYKGFEGIIDKYENFIRLFLQEITKGKSSKKDEQKLKKQHEINKCFKDTKIIGDGAIAIELPKESPINKLYQLGDIKIEIQKSNDLSGVFSWNEVDENFYKLEYNMNDDRFSDPKLFTEVYFLRLVGLIKLITLGKYNDKSDVLDIINNIILKD